MNPVTKCLSISRKMKALREEKDRLMRENPHNIVPGIKLLAQQYQQLYVQYREAHFEAFGEFPSSIESGRE